MRKVVEKIQILSNAKIVGIKDHEINGYKYYAVDYLDPETGRKRTTYIRKDVVENNRTLKQILFNTNEKNINAHKHVSSTNNVELASLLELVLNNQVKQTTLLGNVQSATQRSEKILSEIKDLLEENNRLLRELLRAIVSLQDKLTSQPRQSQSAPAIVEENEVKEEDEDQSMPSFVVGNPWLEVLRKRQ